MPTLLVLAGLLLFSRKHAKQRRKLQCLAGSQGKQKHPSVFPCSLPVVLKYPLGVELLKIKADMLFCQLFAPNAAFFEPKNIYTPIIRDPRGFVVVVGVVVVDAVVIFAPQQVCNQWCIVGADKQSVSSTEFVFCPPSVRIDSQHFSFVDAGEARTEYKEDGENDGADSGGKKLMVRMMLTMMSMMSTMVRTTMMT